MRRPTLHLPTVETHVDDELINSGENLTFAIHGELPPSFGLDANPQHGIIEYVNWWSDGEDSRFEQY